MAEFEHKFVCGCGEELYIGESRGQLLMVVRDRKRVIVLPFPMSDAVDICAAITAIAESSATSEVK